MPMQPWYADGASVRHLGRGHLIAQVATEDGSRAAFVNAQIAHRIAELPRLEKVAKQALSILETSAPLGSSDVRKELAAVLEAIRSPKTANPIKD